MRKSLASVRRCHVVALCAAIVACSCVPARAAELALEAEPVLAAKPVARVAPGSDKPRPGIWLEYPELKTQHDDGLKKVDVWLKTLKPEVFAEKFPGLAKLADSSNGLERRRALQAVAVLRDMSGVPILVAPIASAGSRDKFQAAMHLSDWVYGSYHAAGRKIPGQFAPLLPVFVKALVDAGDEPNVRARCFMVIGSLAGPEWLPLVKDLSASRHPAVTHWSGWAVKQLSGRSEKASKK